MPGRADSASRIIGRIRIGRLLPLTLQGLLLHRLLALGVTLDILRAHRLLAGLVLHCAYRPRILFLAVTLLGWLISACRALERSR